jgi:hypothetical protein
MMKIYSRLPTSRFEAGELWVEDTDAVRVYGPVRCRGEADNAGAMQHGNPQEDPKRAYGDHPYGLYRAMQVVYDPKPEASYGPVFIAINPLAGEAWEARVNGRTGFGIHGGRLHEDGRLRETYGCLRVDDDTALALADLLEKERAAGREVFYECRSAG